MTAPIQQFLRCQTLICLVGFKHGFCELPREFARVNALADPSADAICHSDAVVISVGRVLADAFLLKSLIFRYDDSFALKESIRRLVLLWSLRSLLLAISLQEKTA